MSVLSTAIAKALDHILPDRSNYTEAELQCVEDAVIKSGVIYVQTYMRDVNTLNLHQVYCQEFRYREFAKAMDFVMDEVSMLLNYCIGFEHRRKPIFESIVIIGGKDYGPEIKEMKLPRNDIILLDLKKELADEFSLTMFDDVRKQKYAKKFQLLTTHKPARIVPTPDENGDFYFELPRKTITDFSKLRGIPIYASANMKAGTIIKVSSDGGACPLNRKDIGSCVIGFTLKECREGEVVEAYCIFGARVYRYTGKPFSFYLFNHKLKELTILDSLKGISDKKDVQYFEKVIRNMLMKVRDIDDLVKVQKYLEIKTPDWKELFQIVVTSHGNYNFHSLIGGRGKINQKLINHISQHGFIDIIEGEHWIGEKHYPERVVTTIRKQDLANSKNHRHRIEKMVEVIRKGI